MESAMDLPRRPGPPLWNARRRLQLLVLMLLLALPALDAIALRRIAPGQVPQLAPGEGLLLVVFDTDNPVVSARFRQRGTLFNAGVLRHLKQGRTTELYAVPAGHYQWGRIDFSQTYSWRNYFDLGDDAEYAFEVKSGQLNYTGDLVFRPSSRERAVVHVANRALPAIDWLEATHPALAGRYPLQYSGRYPDPFPAFYRQARGTTALPAGIDAGRRPPTPAGMPIAPARMWKPDRVRDSALSPDGTLVVVELREPDDSTVLELIDLAAGRSQRIATSKRGFVTVAWESDRIVLAGIATGDGEALAVLRVGEPVAGARRVTVLHGPVGGRVVDLLPQRAGEVLYEKRDSAGKLQVKELLLDNQRSLDAFHRAMVLKPLNSGVVDDLGWYADGHGRLRATMAKVGDELALMHGLDGKFREVLRYSDDGGFEPLQLSHDGDLIYGLTDAGREQRDFVVFDPARGEVARTLYSRPGVDLVTGLFDEHRQPIGATYYEDGQLVSHYFDARHAALAAQLSRAFPGRTVMPLDRSDDGRKWLLRVDGSDLPPQLYYLDADRRHAQLLEESMPHLAGVRFVPAQVLAARSRDGMAIEAFLTLPPAAGKRPLVVMPHGGPIGVADSRHFDREVQFIASLGYAVLQVNFRGSDGYGRAFREAGNGQFGAGIEDDIDAAVAVALAAHPLDETRMCALGSSYGGYSALISAIRWPARYRCVVSIAGVSDRLLAFTASDSSRSVQGRAQLTKIMGDPAHDAARMVEGSPLYQYRKLSVPVMLVHGGEDFRVDMEQTRRLVRMLALDGRAPILQAFPDEGHGLRDLQASTEAWTGVAGFLQAHLGSATPVMP